MWIYTQIKFSHQIFSAENSQASQVIGILLVVIKCLTLLWQPNKLVFFMKKKGCPPMAQV